MRRTGAALPLTALLAAALLAAALLPGCAEREPAADAAEAAEQTAEDGDSSSTEAALDTETASEAPAEEAIAPHQVYPRGARVLPHDYAIGPLQDLLAAAEAEQEVTAALLPFLRALAEGRVDAATVAPDRLRSLRRSLQYHLDAGAVPRAARIGAVTLAQGAGEAHATVRLFGEPGRVAGEVYLEAGAGGWLVVDVQLDLPRLAQPYSPREREFVPRSDRPLLIR